MPHPDDDHTGPSGRPDDAATRSTEGAEADDSAVWDDEISIDPGLRRRRWDPQILVGTTIDGRYEVGEKIGEGGFSYVFRARQLSVGRDVAIKLPHSCDDPEAAERLRQGVRRQVKLDHRFIATVIDAGETRVADAVLPYLVMDLVSGGRRLTDFCRDRGLDLPGRLQLFADACAGVGFAHANGFVHCDLKPGNILVNESGEPRVIDFDVARDPEAVNRDITQSLRVSAALHQRIIGTVQYMSPEHQAGHNVDCRSDVYSLGVTLCELVTGRPPHLVGSLGHAVPGSQGGGSPAGGSLHDELPTALRRIVSRCMRFIPAERYGDAAELATDVQRCLDTQSWREPRWRGWQRSAMRMARDTPARLAAAFPARIRLRIAAGIAVIAVAGTVAAAAIRERSRARHYESAFAAASRALAGDGSLGDAATLGDAAVDAWRAWRGTTPLPLPLVCLRGLGGDGNQPPDAGSALALSPSGDWAAYGRTYGPVVERPTTQRINPLPGLSGSAVAFAFDRSERLAAADARGRWRLWNLATFDSDSRPLLEGTLGGVSCLDVSPDGSWMALATASGTVEIWNASAKSQGVTVKVSAGKPSTVPPVVCFNTDATRLLCAVGDGMLRVIDVRTGVESDPVAGLAAGPTALCRSADGSRLAVFVAGGRLRLHDPLTGRPLSEQGNEPARCSHAAFTPDGRKLVVVRTGAVGPRRADAVEIFDTSRPGSLRSEAVLTAVQPIDGLVLGGDSMFAVRIDGTWRLSSAEPAVPPAAPTVAQRPRHPATGS